jgi:hypothetical protein
MNSLYHIMEKWMSSCRKPPSLAVCGVDRTARHSLVAPTQFNDNKRIQLQGHELDILTSDEKESGRS